MGVMAFHLLTGSLPFTAVTLSKLLQMQVEHRPPDIRRACPEIDAEFARFIDSALSKDPQDRISDWDEIRAILNTIRREQAHLDDLTDKVGITVRDVVFEDFLQAPDKVLDPAWRALCVRPGRSDLAQTRHRRQASSLNRNFIRRFRAELARRDRASAA